MDGADRSAAAEDTDSSSSSSGDEEDNKLKDLIAQTNATVMSMCSASCCSTRTCCTFRCCMHVVFISCVAEGVAISL